MLLWGGEIMASWQQETDEVVRTGVRLQEWNSVAHCIKTKRPADLSIVKRLGGFSWHKGTAFILNSQTFLKKKNHQVWFKIFKIFDFGGAKTCAGLVFSCIYLYANILQAFSSRVSILSVPSHRPKGKLKNWKVEKLKTEELWKI